MSNNDDDPAKWPVYTMRYWCSGVEKQLRLEWHHTPESWSVGVVIQCIKDYIENPQDVMNNNTGETFKTLLPDYCIVLKDGHVTQTSATNRAPDSVFHISVRFGRFADRARPGPAWAYSVHIYLSQNTGKYVPKKVVWNNPTGDKTRQAAVHKNRTRWPAGATATTAPPAPNEQPLVSTPSIEGLVPASLPTTNPWGGSIIPQRPSNTPHGGDGPGQGPATGDGRSE
ncbi:predicted protein [Histoplasma capsulatum H143]|uniref:Uncharacterized protein n=1 Tax=Ajellomyces capsulatus (strain H143) TaxID=544712 RepID=C6HNZ2_AJECH|nr:predicted protein [Histoplasma capsulatum H143]